MANTTTYEVRANFTTMSLDAVTAGGTSFHALHVDRTAAPLEELVLASVKRSAVSDALRALAEDQPLQAEVFRRHLGLGGGGEESLNGIARSMGLTPAAVQSLNRQGRASFEMHLQLHPSLAYLRAA